MDPDKIVVTGDSAGGHLSVSLTIMAILNNFKIPTGVMPVYPAMSSNLQDFVPSNLCALDDTFLTSAFLNYCLESFVAHRVNPATNFLTSPVLTPDEIMQKFPPVRIFCCECDPLRDQAFNFALRLKKLGGDVKLHIFHDYIHGFLSFDLKISGVEEYHNAVGRCKDTL
jgi:acetyl esterase